MFELVAHRGYAYRFPENTLVALEGAVAAGARYVEVDVQMTLDGVPMLFHDGDCLRLCGIPGPLARYPYSLVSTLSASWPARFGAQFLGNPLASLVDLVSFLERHPNVTAFVEIKQEALHAFGERRVIETVFAVLQPVLAQTVLISFSVPALRVGRSLWPRIGVVTRRYGQFRARGVQALAPEYHFCDRKGLPRWGRLAHVGCDLVVYEIDDAALACSLGHRGATLIETFAVAELAAALEVMGHE